MPPVLDIDRRGQVFTPPAIVLRMLGLIRNRGRVLEPSCGDGAFSSRLPGCVAIEQDARQAPSQALVADFFAYPAAERFDTIIGNPPYVKARDILAETRGRLDSPLLDGHANLYLHFIEKCVRHLNPGGELIFITPRDFLKATGAARLNAWLFEQGTITDFEELGDARVFAGATPNCAIWRFEKGDAAHRTRDGRRMVLAQGQLLFTRGSYGVPLSGVFSVKVGAVSGADRIFAHDTLGNADFVCSHTARTGRTRRMIYDQSLSYLEPFKETLLARRVRKFDESNWWQWGRRHPASAAPRIYVNHKTRNAAPFFTHPSPHFDGAVLGLFPHRAEADVAHLARLLNQVDWAELGFVCDGRFLFTQRSLENAPLPPRFAAFVADHLAADNPL
ncbi:SAM-dependent methyltransferase [Denitratisoma sp. DHT3]|uniref:Eco57I restriction-modification methylase domain-containing protein n=1 Tax=Denitratisoma sp. DHT3 TaxID=1981880 RepID=UPI001198B564|nr:class I SAM-dependent methyltransferase [Denitratisoma sp. DHT3]QDX81842.1 SAM-dependent methyltransferase [Denitratisoma sp. DHT3]